VSWMPTVGTKRTITASNAGSAITGGRTEAKLSGVAPPSRSTGFALLPSAGITSASAARVGSLGCGSSRPAASQASAARMPSPPALVTTATRRPRGTGWAERDGATPTGRRLGGEERRHVDQLVKRLRPDHARLVEERVDGHIRAGERRRVRT